MSMACTCVWGLPCSIKVSISKVSALKDWMYMYSSRSTDQDNIIGNKETVHIWLDPQVGKIRKSLVLIGYVP